MWVVFVELLDKLQTQNGLNELIHTVATVEAHHFLTCLLLTSSLLFASQSDLVCIDLAVAVIGLPIFRWVRG